ncbi:MAG: hypothetical protein H6662_08290 [Ardenticatenaceae bacterium]|nr:hypothetical protein [Ardenticatenaceae bacterium]
MKPKHLIYFLLIVSLIIITTSVSLADDGEMFRRNISKTPDQETERANLVQMTFYVPAQTSEGELTSIEYHDAEGTLVDTRDFAKPLVAVYIDGLPEEEPEDMYTILSGAGWGAHDAYTAVSLDDGATWKRTNLSLSADLSSFILDNGHPYPGDAHNMTFALAGDKVLVGWISKYCDGGSPAYTWQDEDSNDLYPDIWGVAGAQDSVNYTLQGFPEVGEVPYSCVWSARGTLLEVDADGIPTDGGGFYDVIWTKAERLTSGRRDANRLEMNGDSASGFMMTWQEDPEGLRPGQGLGPGEGWSGAVVNQQTDLWYSYISMEDFEMVQTSDDDDTPISIYEYTGDTMPKVAMPMALPVRLTDNKMCKSVGDFPYCYIDFDNVDENGELILPDDLDSITQSTESTLCTEVVQWTNPGGTTLNLCVAEDGRVLQGRVGSSRPRVNVQPYDSDGDGIYDSAWVIMGSEESKALGEGSTEEDLEPEDVGKNMWYYTFDLLHPNIVAQGGMLNQPAVCGPQDEDCTEGEFFPLLEDDFGNLFYETEISRRFSHFSQPIHQIGNAGVSAVLIVKQGIINQGGPADIFLRRLVVPDDVWEPCPEDSPYDRCLPAGYNPYAYENMACDEWVYTDGSNPRYVEGLCLSNMINVSGGTIVSCDNGSSGTDCAADFPWDGGESPFPKVTEWVQTAENLDDQSWENPYDVAKGHRGFVDGDFIMMMYAWSPNWKANTVGNDHYNLYARRSFDGGLTWTTLPVSYTHVDGTVWTGEGTETCENYGAGSEYITACTTYGPGEFEQSRNLSQLTGNKVTILDPRYTPSGGIKMLPVTDKLDVGGGTLPYDDDALRDPSMFFVVYETGDNTTVAEGEAVPLDLFYSRAYAFGDYYDLVEYSTGDGEIVEGFDWLEHDRDDLSGEAANTANPGASYYYVVWNQWQEDEHENVSESDIIFRRIMYLDDAEDESTPPITSILYVSHTMADYEDTLLLIGSARDGDHVGDKPEDDIGGYEWTDTFDGITTIVGTQKQLSLPVNNAPPGWHQFQFRAKDKGGNWSPGVDVQIWIVEELHQAYLPMATGN